jgi:hypothetical protein
MVETKKTLSTVDKVKMQLLNTRCNEFIASIKLRKYIGACIPSLIFL